MLAGAFSEQWCSGSESKWSSESFASWLPKDGSHAPFSFDALRHTILYLRRKAHVFASPYSHEPHWEPGTYVATLTRETTQQHTDHREIPFLCPQFRATHTFDGDIVKLLLDRRLEYGVHFL
jgi:hypothetical protein